MLPSEDKRKSACCGWEKVTINVPIQAVLVKNWLRVFGRVFCCFGPSQLRTILSRTMQQTFPPRSAAFSLFWMERQRWSPQDVKNGLGANQSRTADPVRAIHGNVFQVDHKLDIRECSVRNLTQTAGWRTLRKGRNSLNHLKRTQGQIHRLDSHFAVAVSLAAYRHYCTGFLPHRAGLPRHHPRASHTPAWKQLIWVQTRTKRMEKRCCLPRHPILPVQTVLLLRGWWGNWGWRQNGGRFCLPGKVKCGDLIGHTAHQGSCRTGGHVYQKENSFSHDDKIIESLPIAAHYS